MGEELWTSRNVIAASPQNVRGRCALRVSYGCHKISKSTSLDCNKIRSDGVVRKDYMWESPGDSHAVAIQWVCMVKDPPVTILDVYSCNIITNMIVSRDMQS